jgi:hypothetical protein
LVLGLTKSEWIPQAAYAVFCREGLNLGGFI